MSAIERIQCLIIGSGPAGYTAAIYAARADMKPVLYEGLQPGGQLTTTNEVENFPGYRDGVTGPEMMIELKDQAQRFDTDVRPGFIDKVDFSGEVHKCWADDGTEIHADTVIISTGASAKYLGLESEQKYLQLGGGVSACAVCDGFFYRGQETVIVGAGDSACEEAHYLSKLCTKVTMLVRRDEFRASKIMAERVRKTENIEILYNTETKEVLGDGQLVTGVKAFNNKTNEEFEISNRQKLLTAELEAIAKKINIKFVDPMYVICESNKVCRHSFDNKGIISVDGGHLTPYGARHFGYKLDQYIKSKVNCRN